MITLNLRLVRPLCQPSWIYICIVQVLVQVQPKCPLRLWPPFKAPGHPQPQTYPHCPKNPRPHQGGNNVFLKSPVIRWRICSLQLSMWHPLMGWRVWKLEVAKYVLELKIGAWVEGSYMRFWAENLSHFPFRSLMIEDWRLVKQKGKLEGRQGGRYCL